MRRGRGVVWWRGWRRGRAVLATCQLCWRRPARGEWIATIVLSVLACASPLGASVRPLLASVSRSLFLPLLQLAVHCAFLCDTDQSTHP